MARPRFRRLSYDLYESLERAHVSSSTLRILLVIIDFTIGYRRESQWISLSTFQKKTGLSRKGVVRAIHDAEQRGMVWIERQGTNPKSGTIYAVNTDFSGWITSKPDYTRTSKPQVTSKLVNHSSPDWCTPVHQTGDIVTSATQLERNSNVTLKEDTTTHHHQDTTPRSSLNEELHPTLAGKNGKKKILGYLESNGVSTLNQLSKALGMRYGTVQVYLHALKKDGLADNPERGRWRAVRV